MPTTILISTATAIAISNAQKLKTLILYTKRNVFIERLTSQLLRFRVHNNCKWEKALFTSLEKRIRNHSSSDTIELHVLVNGIRSSSLWSTNYCQIALIHS